MRKLLPFVIGAFVASLVWLGISTVMRQPEENWDGQMPAGMDFIGTWQIESRMTNGVELSGENLQKVRDYGFDSFAVLNLDATAELNLYGNVFKGTWLAQGETDAIVTTDQIRKALHLEGDHLILGDQQDYFVFVRSTPETYEAYLTKEQAEDVDEEFVEYLDLDSSWTGTPDEQADQGDGTEQSAESVPMPDERGIYPLDQTIVDDALVTIKITGKATDHVGCSGYLLSITNNSAQPFTATRSVDSFTVNGKPANPVLGENLEPGESVEVFMWWEASDVTSLDELVNVEGILEIDEVNGFEAYATYAFSVA